MTDSYSESVEDKEGTLILINYEYLRKVKAKCLKRREETAFPQVEVGVQTYSNSTILPLRKNKKSELMFGEGGN